MFTLVGVPSVRESGMQIIILYADGLTNLLFPIAEISKVEAPKRFEIVELMSVNLSKR